MQTLFQIAGTYIGYKLGGPLGASVGSIIGAGIGNELFPNKIEGPKLSDLSIISSTYGAPIPLVYGNYNRISGNVIWTTGLIETAVTKSVGSFPSKTKVTTYQYKLSCAVALSAGKCKNIKRIWANKKLIYEDVILTLLTPDYESWTVTSGITMPTAPFYSLSFYPGDNIQTPDPTMQSYLGATNVPSYRNTCYVVLKDLQLADFGNSMPNLEFEISGIDGDTASMIVNDICQRSDMTLDEYALSPKMAGYPIKGYAIASAGSAINAINPLITAYGFTASEQGGTVRFTARGSSSRATIEIGDLGAKVPSDSDFAQPPIKVSRAPDFELPQEVSVTYFDTERDYQSGTQKSSRSLGNSAANFAIELPLVLDPSEAKKMADRGLWEPWTTRTTANFSVSEKYGFLNAGDVVTVPISNRYVSMRISSVTRGNNGIYEIESNSDDQFIFDGSDAGIIARTPPQEVRVVVDSVGYLFNPPILSDDQTDSSYVATVDNERSYWSGAELYEFPGTLVETFNARSIIGTCNNVLGGVSTTGLWDRKNTLTVTLTYPLANLESVDEALVIQGVNMAWVGAPDGSTGEIIQFANATYVSPGVYTLSTFLRGRRATDHYASNHLSNEVFVFLNNFVDIGATESEVNGLKAMKIVTAGQDPSALSYFGFRPIGEGARCRTVANLYCVRNDLNEVTVTWTPRTRLYPPLLGSGEVPLGEAGEFYEIDITNEPGTTVVRTYASTSRSFTYNTTQQIADGLTPGNPVYGYIYQISAVRGRGHRRRFIA